MSRTPSIPRRRNALNRKRSSSYGIGCTNTTDSNVLVFSTWWTFYFDEKPTGKVTNYKELIKTIGTFHTVQEFWRYYNNFVDPSSFPKGSNLRLFKKDIFPSWEDTANEHGGRMIKACNKKETGKLWISLVLSVLGNHFPHNYEICGIILSIKEEYDTLSVWVRNSDEEADSFKANLATFQSLFDDISVYPVYFQKHNESTANKQTIGPQLPNRPIPGSPSKTKKQLIGKLKATRTRSNPSSPLTSPSRRINNFHQNSQKKRKNSSSFSCADSAKIGISSQKKSKSFYDNNEPTTKSNSLNTKPHEPSPLSKQVCKSDFNNKIEDEKDITSTKSEDNSSISIESKNTISLTSYKNPIILFIVCVIVSILLYYLIQLTF